MYIKHVLMAEFRIYTADGYFGFKTTKKRIYLDRRLKIGVKIIELGMRILNEDKCELFTEDVDGDG